MALFPFSLNDVLFVLFPAITTVQVLLRKVTGRHKHSPLLSLHFSISRSLALSLRFARCLSFACSSFSLPAPQTGVAKRCQTVCEAFLPFPFPSLRSVYRLSLFFVQLFCHLPLSSIAPACTKMRIIAREFTIVRYGTAQQLRLETGEVFRFTVAKFNVAANEK